MKWYINSFQDLSNESLYKILKARTDVFVVEQNCPYPELDNYDQASIHYYLKVNNEIAAYVRILPKGSKYREVSIGRVLVAKKYRGNGYARELMQKAIDYIFSDWGETEIKIQAQVYLEEFYTSLGFRKNSMSYLEDGIPHIDMIWDGK